MKSYAETYPYRYVLVLTAIVVAVHLLAQLIINLAGPAGPAGFYHALLADILLFIIALVLLFRWRWWRRIGFRSPRHPGDFWLFLVPLLPILDNLRAGPKPFPLNMLLFFLVAALLVGFVEETYFRGLMLRPLADRGIWRAAIITSLLFGLLHSLNILAGGNPLGVLQQMVAAAGLGFMYAALVIRTGLLWPTVIIHFGTDFSAFLVSGQALPQPSSGAGFIVAVIFFIIFAGYGVILLIRGRKSLRLLNPF